MAVPNPLATPDVICCGYRQTLSLTATQLAKGRSLTIPSDSSQSYFAMLVFGIAQMTSRRLISLTGDSLSPSFYMMFTAALSIIALAFVRRRRYPR